jgi:hypothetical protein
MGFFFGVGAKGAEILFGVFGGGGRGQPPLPPPCFLSEEGVGWVWREWVFVGWAPHPLRKTLERVGTELTGSETVGHTH